MSDDLIKQLKDTTDELRNLRKQYSLVVGDNIRLRGVVDSMKSSRAAIERETLERAAVVADNQVRRRMKQISDGINIGAMQSARWEAGKVQAGFIAKEISAMIEEKTDE